MVLVTSKLTSLELRLSHPVGKIAEKAVFRSVFLTIWHCVLSAELTKTHYYRLFFGHFAH